MSPRPDARIRRTNLLGIEFPGHERTLASPARRKVDTMLRIWRDWKEGSVGDEEGDNGTAGEEDCNIRDEVET